MAQGQGCKPCSDLRPVSVRVMASNMGSGTPVSSEAALAAIVQSAGVSCAVLAKATAELARKSSNNSNVTKPRHTLGRRAKTIQYPWVTPVTVAHLPHASVFEPKVKIFPISKRHQVLQTIIPKITG